MNTGIGVLGFSGGEPFLYPEFLTRFASRAAALGFRFDRIMTNGVWQHDAAHAERTLAKLADAGFSGKIGLSVDKFHGSHTRVLAEFCRIARQVFARDEHYLACLRQPAPGPGIAAGSCSGTGTGRSC